MMIQTIADQRLRNQSIVPARHRTAAGVVEWLGAVQAQEYEPAKWGLGLRIAGGAVDAGVERAFEEGRILRTHLMRPTWHFVTPADIRWMLELTGPRVQRVMAPYNGHLGLDAATMTRGTKIIERALGDREYLTRTELGERLQRAGLAMNGMRLAHLAMHAEQEGVICSGPRRGKKSTYALIAERAPDAPRLSRDESIARLTLRFFKSHGPATVRDFVWWSGLPTADARRGLEMIKARREEVDGQIYWTAGRTLPSMPRPPLAHLLPIYDEYVVAYRDRGPVPHGPLGITPAAGGFVTFQHAVVIAGQIAGTWRLTRSATGIALAATLLRPVKRGERTALAEAARRYERFVGVPVSLSVS
jgi:hypothetical protein